MPRHTKPPDCNAVVVTGSWRQSVNSAATPPTTVARRNSDNHSDDQNQ